MFRFYLNNTLVSDPINWDEFSETIERDDSIKGILPKYEIKMLFNAGGYDYLFGQMFTNGFCQLIELRVDYKCAGNTYKPILEGYIFLSECKFNLNKCTVECEVEDNNFGARIFRNKSIKTYIDTLKTKNDETLTVCTSTQVEFFTPLTGVYGGTKRKCFDVKDAFRFLVEFMTDNLVGFESTYLDTINMTLISGDGIRNPSSGLAPFISFEDLFKEVNKKFPIAFTMITGTDGRPTIKIEEEAYFFNATNSIQIDNIEDLRQSFNNEILYSSVKFGGETVTFNAALHHFGYIRFLSFREEEYFLQGACNIDKVLDLYGDFICDSNIIEELFATATTNDTYDLNVFFIEQTLAQATQTASPTTLIAPYYYNASLTNREVSNRYNYNGSLALYLSGAIIGFRASKNADYPWGSGAVFPSGGAPCPSPPDLRYYTSSAQYITFQDDSVSPNFDTAGNYDGVNTYTASAAGEFVFEAHISYSPFKPSTSSLFNMYYKGVVELRRFNSLNVLIESYQVTDPAISTGFYSSVGWHSVLASTSFTLDVGDYVKVAFWLLYCPVNCALSSSWAMNIKGGSYNTYFRTLSAPTSGGVFQSTEVVPYKASKFEFEQPISSDKYDTMKLDLSQSIIFNNKPLDNKTGWIRKLTRKFSTGETKWELISNITNSN